MRFGFAGKGVVLLTFRIVTGCAGSGADLATVLYARPVPRLHALRAYTDRLRTARPSDGHHPGQNRIASSSAPGARPRCRVSPAFRQLQLRPATIFCWHLLVFRFTPFIYIANKKMKNRLTKTIINIYLALFAKLVISR